jgi:gamma-glutamyltranspeptidase/glutathione hydrolase
MGCRGAVASAHPLASMAGIRILLEGGNAVDAAVAVASTLNVVEPFMSGAGGIGLMLISRKGGRERHVLDFMGLTPAATTLIGVTEDELAAGPKACATPGNLGGWLSALERFGSMPREKVFASAIQHAEQGVPLTWMGCSFFEYGGPKLRSSAEAARLYQCHGTAPAPGMLMRYEDLAKTFRIIVEGGAEAFYSGPIARAIDEAMKSTGGWLSTNDLAAFRTNWCNPVGIDYRGTEIVTAPHSVSSFQLLETMNILEGYDVAGWGHNSANYLHHLIESIKLATADRHAYEYGDAAPLSGLLSKAYAAAQRGRINPNQAAVSEGERPERVKLPGQLGQGYPDSFLKEQTTHFSCADSDGTVVSVTQTLGEVFGSGFAIPGTGLLLNNALRYTDLNPESPNALKANHKFLTMMSPAQVFTNDSFVLSLGTPGSYGILQTIPQMVANVLDFNFNIQEAIEQPRVRAYRDTLVRAESRISEDVRSALIQRGHNMDMIDEWSPEVGGGQGIARDPETGVWSAGADPRRDGYALAV